MANGGTTEGAQCCAFGGFGPGHPGESLGDNRRRYTKVEETVGGHVSTLNSSVDIQREANVLCFRLSSNPHLIQSLSSNHISGCL